MQSRHGRASRAAPLTFVRVATRAQAIDKRPAEKKPEVKTEKPKMLVKMEFEKLFAFAKSKGGKGPAAATWMKTMFAEYKRIEFHEEYGVSHGTLVQVYQPRSNSNRDARRERGAWQVEVKEGDKNVLLFEDKNEEYPLYINSSDFTQLGKPIDWEVDFQVKESSVHPVTGPEWEVKDNHVYRHHKAAKLGCFFCRD